MAVKREKVVQTAEKFVQRGKLNAAIREYRKVLAEQPDDAMTLNRVGDLYARSNQIEEAIGLFTQIAENYTADGFFPKATAIYKKIIKLDPTRLGVYEKLAELYHRQGLLNEARTQYQVLADYYLKHDNATSATAIYERMTEVDPDDPSLRVHLAELYQGQKLLDKAMAQYRAIAQLMLDHGHADEAEQVFLKALQVDHADLGFIEEGVLKLRDADADAAAARFLSKAVALNPRAAEIAERSSVPVAVEAEEEPAEEVAAPAQADESREPAQAAAVPAVDPDGEEAEADLVLDLDADSEPPEELTGAGVEPEPADEPAAGDRSVSPAPFEDEMSSGEITLEMDALGLGLEPQADTVEAPPAAAGGELPDLGTDPVMEDPAAAPEPAGVLSEAPPSDGSIDPDFLERTAAELHPQRIQQEEDLLTEAEVLVKYGLAEKATERLGELLQLNARHVGGRALLIRLHLDQGSHQAAADLATALSADAAGSEAWAGVWEQLQGSGFERAADGTVRPPSPEGDDLAAAEAAAVGEEVMRSFDEVTGVGAPSGDGGTEVTPPADLAAEPAATEPAPDEAVDDGVPAFEDLELELDSPFFEVETVDEETGAGATEVADEAAVEPAAAAETAFEMLDSSAVEATPPAAPPAAEELPAEETPAGPAAAEPAAEAAAPPSAPTQAKKKRRSVEDMLASLTAEVLPGRRKPPTAAPPTAAPSAPPAEKPAAAEPATAEAAAGAKPAAEAAPPTAPPTAPPAATEPAAAAAPPAAPAEEPAAAPPAEASPEWLEQTVPGESPAEDDLFSDEDDFFDLAAELEEELSREGALEEGDDLLLETPREQSLEEIVEGFKKGVSENLSQEDHTTHFDLGIAYREMGLLDEAIGEFQVAAKSPDLLVECCSMLGLSFLDKGLPELAVKWYSRGLDSPGLSEDEQLGLLYDLGNAYMAIGDMTAAHATFVDLYGTNSNYRDVVAKIEETRKR